MDARALAKKQYDDTMAELYLLEKSQKTEDTAADDLETLTKALEAEIAGDPLQKSGDKEPDGDEDDKDKGAEPDETEMEKSIRLAAEDDLRKAQAAENADYEELVKASEAYASLEESIQKSHGGIQEQLSTMCKSMGALLNLNLKMAGVISAQSTELAGLKKSRELDLDAMQKSIATLGGQPVVPNKAVLGKGTLDEEPMTKSVSEVNELLLKSVQEGKVDSRYLGIYGTYKIPECLPADVRKVIGI